MSEDPLGFAAGINFYSYVNNNPVNANDPSGMAGAKLAQEIIDIIKSFKPGPFAGEGIPTSSGRATAGVQREINAAGSAGGCHICGTTNPGTISGNWVLDHMEPTKLANGMPQLGYPSCLVCSQAQGGYVTALRNAGVAAAAGVVSTDANATSNGILGTGISWSDVKGFAHGVGSLAVDILTDPSSYIQELILLTPTSTGGCSSGVCSDMMNNINHGATGGWGSSSSVSGSWGSAAAGGYLLYPNKANNNMMQSVYSK